MPQIKKEEQVKKIQTIMGKNDAHKKTSIEDFTEREKFSAIYNWNKYADTKINMEFVDSLYEQFVVNGRISSKQLQALNNICLRFSIDIEKWVIQ